MREIDVLVVGELNADLILSGDVVPAFGQAEKLIDEATLTLGSSSAIFACGVARLGLRVAFIGKTGDDDLGHIVRRSLQERGVDISGVIVDPTLKTGLSIIFSQKNDRAILTHLGSIAALRYQDIDLSLLTKARHLHLGSYFLLAALLPDIPALFEAAQAKGLTTSLDTNYDPAESWNSGLADVLRHTDIFLPNETELCAIARQAELTEALQSLAGQVSVLAVKVGNKGGIARQGTETAQAASLPVAVVDTTGAGDAFDAGFIYGYLAGWDLARTLQFGCACGSLSTRAAGGITAQATLAEAQEALSQFEVDRL